VKLLRGGKGAPLIFLHDAFCLAWLPLHDRLASEYEVFVPIHPGFAGSDEGFEQFEMMEDLVIHYLDLCEVLKIQRPALAGASFGGWIAAEWAMRYSERLRALVLIDALGLRLTSAPVADVLSLDGPALRRTLFAEPNSLLALQTLPDTPQVDAIVGTILGRRALARFAWQFPDDPSLLRYLLSHTPADINSLGRARSVRSHGARRCFSQRYRRLTVRGDCRRGSPAAYGSAGGVRQGDAGLFARARALKFVFAGTQI